MPQFSFDTVSEFDVSEMNNAIDQSIREIRTRYDLKGSAASVEFADNDKNSLLIKGDEQFQLDLVLDIVRSKLAKRGIDQTVLDTSTKPEPGNPWRWTIPLKSGIPADTAKKISKSVRDLGLKKLNPQIQGEKLRVTSPSKNDLQTVMVHIKKTDFGLPLQFNNFK